MQNSKTLSYLLTLFVTCAVAFTGALLTLPHADSANAQTPAAPASINIYRSERFANQYRVTWSAVSGATRYQYAYQTRKGTSGSWSAKSSYKNFSSSENAARAEYILVQPGRQYRYFIRAVGGAEKYITFYSTLAQVSNLRANFRNNNEIAIAWNYLSATTVPSFSNNYRIVFEYRIKREGSSTWLRDGEKPSTNPHATSLNLKGVTLNRTYIIQIRPVLQKTTKGTTNWADSAYGPWGDTLTYTHRSASQGTITSRGAAPAVPSSTSSGTPPPTSTPSNTDNLDTVRGLERAGATTTTLTIAWDAVDDAASYTISYGGPGNTSGSARVLAPTTQHTFRNLTPNSSYAFSVIAFNSDKTRRSRAATPTTFRTLAEQPRQVAPTSAPGKVTGVSVSRATGTAVRVEWDRVDGATDYDMRYRRIDGTGRYNWGTSDIGARLAAEPNIGNLNNTYVFQIRAKNNLGEGPWSNFVSNKSNVVLAIPQNIRVTIPSNSQTATVSWDSVSGSNIRYDVAFGDVNTDLRYQTVSTNRHTVTVPYGKTYEFFVRAKQSGTTQGIWSDRVTQRNSNTLQKPDRVTGLRATVNSSTQITLEWDRIEGVTRYIVDINGTERTTNAAAEHPIINLRPNTQYTFRVRAVSPSSSNLYGDWSSRVTRTTDQALPTSLDRATGVDITSSTSDSITVEWNRVNDATSYNIEYRVRGSNTVREDSSSDTREVIINLESDTEYEVRVQGRNSSRTGGWSSWERGSTLRATSSTTLRKVTGLEITATTRSTIELEWDSQSGATYTVWYCVRRGCTTDRDDWETENVSRNRATIDGLNRNTEYLVAVVARDGNNNGPFSDTLAVSTTTSSTPSTPSSSTGGEPEQVRNLDYRVISSTEVNIIWDPVTDNDDMIYEVNYAEVGENWETYTTDEGENSVRFEELESGTSYRFRVRAVNDDRERGDWSEVLTLRTDGRTTFSKVDGLDADAISDTAIELEWDSQSGAAYHIVYRERGIDRWTVGTYSTRSYATIRSLRPNTAYEFSVGPVTEPGEEVATAQLFSDIAVESTRNSSRSSDCQTPPQVTGLRSTRITDTQVNLIWNSVCPGVSGVTYAIYLTSGVGSFTLPVQDNFATVYQLTPSTTYSFAVYAIRSGRQGTTSSQISATTGPVGYQPGVSITGTGTGVTQVINPPSRDTSLYSIAGDPLVNGDLIQAPGDENVYIVKIVGSKRFRRLIINERVLLSYSDFSRVHRVSFATFRAFTESRLVRSPSGQIYFLETSTLTDTGTKRLVTGGAYDLDSVYNINAVEEAEYRTGIPVRF